MRVKVDINQKLICAHTRVEYILSYRILNIHNFLCRGKAARIKVFEGGIFLICMCRRLIVTLYIMRWILSHGEIMLFPGGYAFISFEGFKNLYGPINNRNSNKISATKIFALLLPKEEISRKSKSYKNIRSKLDENKKCTYFVLGCLAKIFRRAKLCLCLPLCCFEGWLTMLVFGDKNRATSSLWLTSNSPLSPVCICFPIFESRHWGDLLEPAIPF